MSEHEVKRPEGDVIRRMLEDQETAFLSPFACKSQASRGRDRPERDCFYRTCFQRDRDRILHSEAFRRLKHKTQVFLAPRNDHFRTRLTHTLEVAQIARTIARGLRLNEDLTEAIAFGHDLGHTPFGHAGEQVLGELSPEGFHHAVHSVRVVRHLEKNGAGLNLTAEVVDGILKHSKGRSGPLLLSGAAEAPLTLEAQVVRLADLVAYINHDIDDAVRAGLISLSDLPAGPVTLLGERNSQRIHGMVKDIILESWGKPAIALSKPVADAAEELRAFLYEKVYTRHEIEDEIEKSRVLLRQMAQYFMSKPERLLTRLHHPVAPDTPVWRTVVDHLASMTDGFAMATFKELFVPHYRLDSFNMQRGRL